MDSFSEVVVVVIRSEKELIAGADAGSGLTAVAGPVGWGYEVLDNSLFIQLRIEGLRRSGP